jgi:membrane associated rhomboid family serine protease
VSRGRPPRWQAALRGAIAPALLGAAASAVGMAIDRKDDGPSFGSVVASSAAWGAASGAAFAAWSQRERWRRVPLTASWPASTMTDAASAPPPDEK